MAGSQAVRASLRGLMGATVKNEKNWHYHFVRPLPLPTLHDATQGVVYADCSFGIKALYKLAGGEDPCGSGFDGWGNSTSMFRHLPHIPFDEVRVGDIGVFGRTEGEQHAVMAYQVARTEDATTVWSHGQEAGPILVSVGAEKRAHPGATLTWLRAVPPDPKPKPEPRVDVVRDGKPWLRRQKVSNAAVWKRVRQAAKTAKTIVVRKAR